MTVNLEEKRSCTQFGFTVESDAVLLITDKQRTYERTGRLKNNASPVLLAEE